MISFEAQGTIVMGNRAGDHLVEGPSLFSPLNPVDAADMDVSARENEALRRKPVLMFIDDFQEAVPIPQVSI